VRNRYFDVVRAVAIVRVALYHATGWAALTIVFPAMGVMFAMAGSLMAASLDRHGIRAVGRRVRRLLPPFWLIGAIFVPLMLLTGGLRVDWHLLYWVLPVQNPPTNHWGDAVLGVIWYIREYLWFMVLSPVALWLFRRWPVPVLAAPLLVRVGLTLWAPDSAHVISDFGLYFGCWLLGFAHHDNLLARVRPWVKATAAGALGATGAWWVVTHNFGRPWDLNDIPLGNALWSMAFVLVLVGFAPRDLAFIDRLPRLRRAVAVLNARAVTVYLWHPTAIVGAGALLTTAGVGLAGNAGIAWRVAGATALVLVAVAAFGWVEDVAARRPVRLMPGAPRAVPAPVSPAVVPVPVSPGMGPVSPVPMPVSPGVGPVDQVGVPAPRRRGAEWAGARHAYEALPR
jgi:peptidoglycan/LPS O-acetylase OafA/YrhL